MMPKLYAAFRKIVFSRLSAGMINNLRRFKWFFLRPFVCDKKTIGRFARTGVELKILERLFDRACFPKRMTIIDIGANIGEYAYYLTKFVAPHEGSCIAFEPRLLGTLRVCIKRTRKGADE